MWHPAAVSICREERKFCKPNLTIYKLSKYPVSTLWNKHYYIFLTVIQSKLNIWKSKGWQWIETDTGLSYTLARHLKLNFPFSDVTNKSSCKYNAEPPVLHNKIKARIGNRVCYYQKQCYSIYSSNFWSLISCAVHVLQTSKSSHWIIPLGQHNKPKNQLVLIWLKGLT